MIGRTLELLLCVMDLSRDGKHLHTVHAIRKAAELQKIRQCKSGGMQKREVSCRLLVFVHQLFEVRRVSAAVGQTEVVTDSADATPVTSWPQPRPAGICTSSRLSPSMCSPNEEAA